MKDENLGSIVVARDRKLLLDNRDVFSRLFIL